MTDSSSSSSTNNRTLPSDTSSKTVSSDLSDSLSDDSSESLNGSSASLSSVSADSDDDDVRNLGRQWRFGHDDLETKNLDGAPESSERSGLSSKRFLPSIASKSDSVYLPSSKSPTSGGDGWERQQGLLPPPMFSSLLQSVSSVSSQRQVQTSSSGGNKIDEDGLYYLSHCHVFVSLFACMHKWFSRIRIHLCFVENFFYRWHC